MSMTLERFLVTRGFLLDQDEPVSTEGAGEIPRGPRNGGVVGETTEIGPLGLVALRLEARP